MIKEQMMMFDRILVPLDRSPLAECVFRTRSLYPVISARG